MNPTSSSVKATISPVATDTPRLRAAEMPGRRFPHHPRSLDIGRRRVGGPVVDDDHLVVGVIELRQAP